MYIAVCDDDKTELNEIILSVEKWNSLGNYDICLRSFSCASEMLDAANKEPFSLYILDILMPGINGIEAALDIRRSDKNADIVFLTSSLDFAYESYDVRATQYLLKPIQESKFFSVLDEVYLKHKNPPEGITVKIGPTLTKLLYKDICFVEVRGKHLYFNLADGTVKEIIGTLKEYEPILLERNEFIQVHRSYIANMIHITEVSSKGIVTFCGKTIPVSRKVYSAVYKSYLDFLFKRRDN